jgi:hypothetical protein
MDEIGIGSNTGRDTTDAHIELDVDEMERSIFPSGSSVLSWAHEEEEGDAYHVGNG